MGNPCSGCQRSWSVDNNTSCHDTCEQYQLYKDGQNLRNLQKKLGVTKQFKENLDEIREEFFDKNQTLNCDEMVVVYKVFEFIKSKC